MASSTIDSDWIDKQRQDGLVATAVVMTVLASKFPVSLNHTRSTILGGRCSSGPSLSNRS